MNLNQYDCCLRHVVCLFFFAPIFFCNHRGLLVVSAKATTGRMTSSTSSTASSQHSENYAVIVSSSRYWFNYRHTVNALTMYRFLKDRGNFTDDRIILMLADEYAVNPRNPYKNFLTSAAVASDLSSSSSSLYHGADTEIDYRGEDVTVENLVRVLAGKAPSSSSSLPVIPAQTPHANIFLYLTGHGGDSFFKFQDVEEIMASDLAAVLRQRWFHRVLFIADTCQAFTLGNDMEDMDDRVVMVGSSLRDESSYAHHSNADLGLAMIERYTHALHQKLQADPAAALASPLPRILVEPYSYESQRAHIGIRPKLYEVTTTTASSNQEGGLVLADFMVNRAATQMTETATARVWSPPSLSSSSPSFSLSSWWSRNSSFAASSENPTLSSPPPPLPPRQRRRRQQQQQQLDGSTFTTLSFRHEATHDLQHSQTVPQSLLGFFIVLLFGVSATSLVSRKNNEKRQQSTKISAKTESEQNGSGPYH